ncbi:phosphodiester glycosidase family protein [Lentibacter sp.]|uniref:phosphodiester glycosidase family protein n=1 Tax=Lentibacter sp. TaxID=2024994 RepID=UPI003F69DF5E
MTWTTRAACAVALVLGFLAQPALATDCEDRSFEGRSYTICEVNAAREEIRLFLKDENGKLLGQFFAVDDRLKAQGKRLGFAMNAGMYHEDRSPVGHYRENGEELMRVIPNAGPGNFGMLPNGIFCVRAGRADVIETKRFLRAAPDCTEATQSGPMLVIDGALHPRFLRDSDSRFLRNGVATSADGARAVFIISNERVTFYEMGRFVRDGLKLPQALYFDGNVSRLYAPELNRADAGFLLGPIVGVVETAD